MPKAERFSRIAPDGTESLLHIFHGVPDRADPSRGPLNGRLRKHVWNDGTAAARVTQCVNYRQQRLRHRVQDHPGPARKPCCTRSRALTASACPAPICSWTARATSMASATPRAFNTCYGGPGCGTVFKTRRRRLHEPLQLQGHQLGRKRRQLPAIDIDRGRCRQSLWDDVEREVPTSPLLQRLRTIFEIAPDGAETVLYTFPGGAGGQEPEGGVVRDAQWQSVRNGLWRRRSSLPETCRLRNRLHSLRRTHLHDHPRFRKTDGVYPVGGLTGDGAGNLYGTTTAGAPTAGEPCSRSRRERTNRVILFRGAYESAGQIQTREGIWLEDVPEPGYGIDDVLIKGAQDGHLPAPTCDIYNWDSWAQKTIKPGTVAGHEFVGRIVAVGTNVQGHKVGDLVSAEGHIVCAIAATAWPAGGISAPTRWASASTATARSPSWSRCRRRTSGIATRRCRSENLCDLRSAGQRRAHRALLRSRRRGRADHRRGADRRRRRADGALKAVRVTSSSPTSTNTASRSPRRWARPRSSNVAKETSARR